MTVEGIGRFVSVGDGGDAELARGADVAEHVQDNAGLAGVVEMEPVAADDVEQVIGGEDPVGRRLDVIAGDVTFFGAQGRHEDPGLGLVTAFGQVLEGQEWGRGAAFAQVNLDGVGLPFAAVRLDGDEVDGEAADHPFTGQSPADLQGLAHDGPGVGSVGREAGAQETLSGRAAEDLVVGGKHLHFA